MQDVKIGETGDKGEEYMGLCVFYAQFFHEPSTAPQKSLLIKNNNKRKKYLER